MPRVTGLIFAFDLGLTTGFAKGRPGDAPSSGIVILKQRGEKLDVALGNLFAFLNSEFSIERPALVVKETIMALEAFKSMNMSQDVVYAHAKYHGIVEGMCNRFGVPWTDCKDSTARKHFIGRGNMGSRQATKAAVVARCHALGLMPRERHDDNQADALAIHDWACATLGSKSASHSNFQFFGQGEGRHV